MGKLAAQLVEFGDEQSAGIRAMPLGVTAPRGVTLPFRNADRVRIDPWPQARPQLDAAHRRFHPHQVSILDVEFVGGVGVKFYLILPRGLHMQAVGLLQPREIGAPALTGGH